MTSASPGTDGPTATPLSGGRPNPHYSLRRSSLIGAEAGDKFGDNGADQAGSPFAGGTIAARRLVSFLHEPLNSQGGQHDHVA